VVTEVTVVGAGASLVAGVTVVTVVVTVGRGASLLLGAGAAVWVVGPGGGGAALVDGADDVPALVLVDVTAGFVDDPALVNDTIA
jgi:hypothetical protein